MATALPASNATTGITTMFAGSANNAARWKYSAIGSAITNSVTTPSTINSMTPSAPRTASAGVFRDQPSALPCSTPRGLLPEHLERQPKLRQTWF